MRTAMIGPQTVSSFEVSKFLHNEPPYDGFHSIQRLALKAGLPEDHTYERVMVGRGGVLHFETVEGDLIGVSIVEDVGECFLLSVEEEDFEN